MYGLAYEDRGAAIRHVESLYSSVGRFTALEKAAGRSELRAEIRAECIVWMAEHGGTAQRSVAPSVGAR